jgi:hypothetical protein
MDSYGNTGFKGISIKRADVSLLFSNNIRTKRLSVTESAKLNDVTITTGLVVLSGEKLISSKDTITDGGFTIGGSVTKDMGIEDYRDEFDPANNQSIFPDMVQITVNNIVAGDKTEENRLNASYWNDWGNDVFDEWGYFYIFDVNSGNYYFPIISPQNLANGVFTTQNFFAFGRTFTIRHGWCVQGIFKFDISFDDDAPFRFGAYGDMGSDGDEVTSQMSYQYDINGTPLTLYYHFHSEESDSSEIFYSYYVPKVVSENDTQTYEVYYDGDEMHMRSKEVTKGMIIYYSKQYDVRDWVINDLETSGDGNVDVGGNLYVDENILSKGYNIGKTTIKTMSDSDYTASPLSLIDGYFKSDTLTETRSFIIPSAANLVASIPNCYVNTSFTFTVNNVQPGDYSRNIQTDSSVIIDSSCYNTSLHQNMIVSYKIVITNINAENESAVLLQENSIMQIIA